MEVDKAENEKAMEQFEESKRIKNDADKKGTTDEIVNLSVMIQQRDQQCEMVSLPWHLQSGNWNPLAIDTHYEVLEHVETFCKNHHLTVTSCPYSSCMKTGSFSSPSEMFFHICRDHVLPLYSGVEFVNSILQYSYDHPFIDKLKVVTLSYPRGWPLPNIGDTIPLLDVHRGLLDSQNPSRLEVVEKCQYEMEAYVKTHLEGAHEAFNRYDFITIEPQSPRLFNPITLLTDPDLRRAVRYLNEDMGVSALVVSRRHNAIPNKEIKFYLAHALLGNYLFLSNIDITQDMDIMLGLLHSGIPRAKDYVIQLAEKFNIMAKFAEHVKQDGFDIRPSRKK